MQSSSNALKHGFSATRILSGGADAQVEELTQRILGSHDHPTLISRASAIAEAEVQIKRVRDAKSVILHIVGAHIESSDGFELSCQLAALDRLDRYEERARASRMKAFWKWLRALHDLQKEKGTYLSPGRV